jgi:aryl-alcohol dehydrogenase-like predicted oxidoreductase
MGPPKDHEQAVAVLRRAVEAGVNHIDTAEYYGPKVSNELIREALYPYPEDLVIVSKVGALRDGRGGVIPAQRPAELRAGVEENLATLGVEQLGAVNIRRMEGYGGLSPSQQVSVEDQLSEMVALRDEGKIAGVGISTAPLAEVQAVSSEITCVQDRYSLLNQDDGGVLDHCIATGIAFVPYFPLGSAFPGMPKVVDDPAVRSVAERLGITPAQAGLAWLLARADNILLIPGTSSLAHLEENLGVVDVHLSDADLAELNDRPAILHKPTGDRDVAT